MKTTRLAAPLLVVMAVLPACLPGRDNPNDTSNRPTASLSVANGPWVVDDLQTLDGHCGPGDSIVPSFSRGRCLVLSAGESSDPQGDADLVSFVFEIQTNGGAFRTIASSGTAAQLTPAELRALPSDEDIAVRVTVTDEDGGESQAEGSFRLENTQPIAVQPGNRFVPRFGSLWLRSTNGMGGEVIGGGLTVRIDGGSAFDAEDDPLRFCWRERQPGNPWTDGVPCTDEAMAAACDVTTPYVERVVAEAGQEDGGAVGYELRVCDGNLWSRPVLAGIALDVTPGWAVEQDFGNAVVLDPAVRTETFPYPLVGDPGFLFPQDEVLAFFGYDDPATPGIQERNRVRIQLVSSSAGGPVGTAVLDGNAVVRRVVPVPTNPLVTWVIANVGSSGAGVYALTGSDGALSVVGPWLPETPLADDGAPLFTAVDRDTGDLWLSAFFEQSVWGLALVGNTIVEIDRVDLADHLPGTRMVTGIALRPHENEAQEDGPHPVWIAHSPHVLVPGDGDPAGILVRGPMGAVVPGSYSVPDDLSGVEDAELRYGWGPIFIDRNVFYVAFFGEGVATVVLHTDEEARLQSFAPTPLVGFEGVVHPQLQQAVLVADGSQVLLRVTPEGSIATVESAEKIEGFHVDSGSGRLWTLISQDAGTPARLVGGLGTGVETLAQRFAVPPAFDRSRPGIDYASGDLWVPSIVPVGASRFYLDGRLADFVEGVDPDGDGPEPVVPFGAAVHVAADPAGEAVWLVTVADTGGHPNVIWRIDPDAPRASPFAAASAGVDGVTLDPEEAVVAAYAQPAVGTTAGALVMLTVLGDDLDAEVRIRRMREDGVLEPAAPIPMWTGFPLPLQAFIARDLVDLGVCGAVRNPAANQIVVRRYSPDLSAFTQTLIPTAGAPRVLAVGAFDGDCWVAFRSGALAVLALTRPSDGGFTPLVTALPSDPAQIAPMITPTTLRPQTAHRVWLGFPQEERLRRFAIDGASLVVEEEVPSTGNLLLVTP